MRVAVLLALIMLGYVIKAQDRLKLKNTVELSGATWDVWGYYDSTTNREYAIVGNNGITIIDITDTDNPFVAGNVSGVSEFDHKVWQHYVYSVSGSGVNGTFGHIIDISDPTNPVKIDSFPSAHNIFIDDKGYMYASNPGLVIYDLNNDPTKPDSIWRGGNEGHDVTVVGDMLYDFHGRSGTNIYDVTDRYKPQFLTKILHPDITYHHQGWPTADGKYLLICDELAKWNKADISVWDISDMDNPEWVSGFNDNSATVHNIFILNNWVYSSYYAAGVRFFDLSDPTNLILTDEYDTTTDTVNREGYTGVFGVYPYSLNNKVLASDRTKGLYIFEFDSTRSKPVVSDELKVEINTVVENTLYLKIAKPEEKGSNGWYRLIICNPIGQIVYEKPIEVLNLYQEDILLDNLTEGMYVLYLRNSTDSFSTTFYVK